MKAWKVLVIFSRSREREIDPCLLLLFEVANPWLIRLSDFMFGSTKASLGQRTCSKVGLVGSSKQHLGQWSAVASDTVICTTKDLTWLESKFKLSSVWNRLSTD